MIKVNKARVHHKCNNNDMCPSNTKCIKSKCQCHAYQHYDKRKKSCGKQIF